MGLKSLLLKVFSGGKEVKALKGEINALRGELNALRGAKQALSGQESKILEEGLNGGEKALGAVGDGFQIAAKKGAAASTMRSGNSYFFHRLEEGATLNSGHVYKSTTSDVIKIGNIELSLSDPRIVKALESKGLNGEIVIGRNASCDIVLKDSLVSGEHLIISQKCPGSKRLYIEDLGSTNGTTVLKTNKYTEADRAADAVKSDKYIELMSNGGNAAESVVSKNPAISRGSGSIELPYNDNCRIMVHNVNKGENMVGADYFLPMNSTISIGGEKIKLSDPVIKEALKSKNSIVIGRSPECDVVINNAMVSRTHLSITQMPDGKILIRDLGSTNGTQFVK